MKSSLNSMPSVLNMIPCKSPFVVPFSAQCYQGLTTLDDFTSFLGNSDLREVVHEMNVREYDKYSRLVRAYFHKHAVIHALIDVRAGIVKTIAYSVQTDEVDVLTGEYFIYQIRQHFDQF